MLYRIVILFISIFISFNSFSQTLKGKVVGVADERKETLPYVSVYWINSSVGTTTDSLGEFKITLKGITDKRLVVSMLGYMGDTIQVKDETYLLVKLQTDIATLEEVVFVLGFVGINGNKYIGLYGSNGIGWGFRMNTANGNIG